MSEELVVSMAVVPDALPVRIQPQVLKCPRLEVVHGNLVWGSMRGHTCTILLNSAVHQATVSYAFAWRTRLITGWERRKPLLFDGGHGEVELRVVSLSSVTILLEDRVKVRTSLLVLPRELEEAWPYPDVVLDVHVLQRGNMLQTFSGGRSFLYIRDPPKLRKIRRLSPEFNTFTVRRADDSPSRPSTVPCEDDSSSRSSTMPCEDDRPARPFTVMLDTSGANFYMSDWCRQRFIPLEQAALPWRVHLYLVGGCRLKTSQVSFLPSMKYDFVMGKELLFTYSAIVDYGRHFVCFQVGPNNIKVKLEAD